MEDRIDAVLRMPYSVFNGLVAAHTRRQKREQLLRVDAAIVASSAVQSGSKAYADYKAALEKAPLR